jgi:hypothetical protein
VDGVSAERLVRSWWFPFVIAALGGCQFPNYNLPAETDGARSGASGGTDGATGGGGNSGAVPSTGGDGSAKCTASQTCVQPPPSGWLGPAAFWKADSGTTPPACSDGYETPTDLHASASGEPASCSCSCGVSGQTCTGQNELVLYTDLNCQTPCASSFSASCAPLSTCSGNQGTIRAFPAAPVGGSCDPQVTKDVEATYWEQDARLCTLSAEAGDACGMQGESCVPTPSPPFASQLCVYRVVLPGQPLPACPESYPNGPEALYAELVDERECGSCACSAPLGGSCGGTVSLGLGDGCDEDFEYEIGSGCEQFALASSPKHISAEYVLTPGSCAVSAEPEPLGAVQPAGNAHVVCCP